MNEGSRNGAFLSEGTIWGVPGGWVHLLGTPKDMFSKALECASVSIWVPLLGNTEGQSFLRTFETKRY